MYCFYPEIDESVLANIYEFEEQQISKFRGEFAYKCLKLASAHGWKCTISIERWIDTVDKCHNKQYDGYTATLQIDFKDSNGIMIEIDENVCSFFENITYIVFDPIRRKYRTFQNEMLGQIRKELEQFFHSLDRVQNNR